MRWHRRRVIYLIVGGLLGVVGVIVALRYP
jgi:hypothetical protein